MPKSFNFSHYLTQTGFLIHIKTLSCTKCKDVQLKRPLKTRQTYGSVHLNVFIQTRLKVYEHFTSFLDL